ncbi:HlyD family efflux transporter periplasmic adaptor subunit [Paraburkholderia sp. C35]|uniref:HlyD family efflux transporter periplasmic adaptor subunit n=1 Tax=Paraburkholderia sp. C35 TaxID=2126993 RepID=UPI000D696DCC|nr:HlyD family efflux transporter periplasmic adaptor subunit [Paraburkholderia sp. C35]
MSEQDNSRQHGSGQSPLGQNQSQSKQDLPQQQPADATDKTQPRKRGRAGNVLMIGALLVIAGVGFYYFVFERNRVNTDDAYVNGNMVRLTPQTSGTVVAINTDQTQFVQRGQVLAQLDPHDNEFALEQAEANLGQTVREVAQLFTEETRDSAAVVSAQTQLTQATQDLERDRAVFAVHGVSQETIEHDEHAVRSSRATLDQARATLASARAAIVGASPDTHPRVLQAEAGLRTAWLAAARTKIVAPVSGYVVRRSVQLGQQVSPSTELLAIVPVDAVWIDANFKENQLRDLRIGQPVNVEADIYGSHVTYHGKVLGLNAGTGSALAVLPAQNASGNWIKIVQRLPVRIGLDPQELSHHPLFVGLSTTVDVNTSNLDGSSLSEKPVWSAALDTGAYGDQMSGAEDEIRKIVATNLGNAPAVVSSADVNRRVR